MLTSFAGEKSVVRQDWLERAVLARVRRAVARALTGDGRERPPFVNFQQIIAKCDDVDAARAKKAQGGKHTIPDRSTLTPLNNDFAHFHPLFH